MAMGNPTATLPTYDLLDADDPLGNEETNDPESLRRGLAVRERLLTVVPDEPELWHAMERDLLAVDERPGRTGPRDVPRRRGGNLRRHRSRSAGAVPDHADYHLSGQVRLNRRAGRPGAGAAPRVVDTVGEEPRLCSHQVCAANLSQLLYGRRCDA